MTELRTHRHPSKFDMQSAVHCALDGSENGVTVDQLVDGTGDTNRVHLTASEIRRTLGWMYGRGRARVVGVIDGQEIWKLCDVDENAKR